MPDQTIPAAVLDRIDRSGGPEACWPWLGARKREGYGVAKVAGKVVRVPRLLLGLTDPREEALHSCDNPPCCNRAHLRAGTRQDNMDDMRERGRRLGRGAKLTPDDILDIRSAVGTQSEIAQRYGVTQGYVSMVRSGVRRAR